MPVGIPSIRKLKDRIHQNSQKRVHGMAETGLDQGEAQEAKIPVFQTDERARRRALLIVFLVMLIDLLGFGIVLPLLPRYGKELLEPLFPGDANRLYRGEILGLLMASFSLMQFIFAPIWGRISDRHGRRPFLLLGLAGSVVFYALFGFASAWALPVHGREAVGLILIFIDPIGTAFSGSHVFTAQTLIALIADA